MANLWATLGIICLSSVIISGISLSPKQGQVHPLEPLTAGEITLSSTTINQYRPGITWMYIWITLLEPEKAVLLTYFLEDRDPPPGLVVRKSFCIVIDPATRATYEAVVDLERAQVESWTELERNIDSTFAADELALISDLVLDDPQVVERLRQYGDIYSNKSYVVSDVWKYGHAEDRPEYEGKRLAQVFFYGRNFENDNFYAHPMGFLAVIDTLQKEVLEIEELPIQSDFNTDDREGDTVPLADGNYDPTVSNIDYRTDVSPIDISQENGPSYTVTRNRLEWQKFKMQIGLNGREGIVLHNINYNDSGTVRPLIYRASISELFVPYGDPRPPFHRKMAMDVGEYGLGFSASPLRSPDGCRGSVHFFDAVNNDMSGNPAIIPQAYCIYEEDAGILWRKMDPETGRVVTARSQRLVLTFIATVSNYDYQFKWCFYQDASIKVEVVLTGIVSQNLLGTFGSPGGHGTIVMPFVNAQFHQHFFAARLDTEFGGNKNTVSLVDIYPDAGGAGSPSNPYGNGFSTLETVLRTQGQARTTVSPQTVRTWKIVEAYDNELNPVSKTRKGWKLHPENSAPLMIKRNSVLHPKCAFTDFDVWVTPYEENQLFAAGFYLNSSGLPEWVERDLGRNVEDEDIVLWHVFGITHETRVEDLPVMPTETIGFWLKPANFFTTSPSVDVMPFVREDGWKRKTKV